MFEGFEEARIDTGEAVIRVRYGGDGPPVLLLHGIPETHLMWHAVAPLLARDFSVVVADLRGYGDSSRPLSTPDHAPYSKRAMARDQLEVMRRLGFDRFAVVGHDRGARCAYRLALDHPECVVKLAVLDIVPTGEALARADMNLATSYWIWFFLAQPFNFPERVVGADPRRFLDYMLDEWSGRADAFPEDVRSEYARCFSNADTIHAICEEYRAAVSLDYQHDLTDRGRRRISCPVLALWSAQGPLPDWYDVLAVWGDWAGNVRGRPLDCGHFLPEEAPDETYHELYAFLTA
jgi:haloacetate dehalogenase